jgi:hypothetical protein
VKLWDKIKLTWRMLRSDVTEVSSLDHGECSFQEQRLGDLNPYLEDDAAEFVSDVLESSLHSLWPLSNANERAATLAARGLVWGALYTGTVEEDDQDQNGLAWEVARLIRDYVPEGQDPDQMPGVDSTEDGDVFTGRQTRQAQNVFIVESEIAAFMDAAISANFQGAVLVTNAIRDRLGSLAFESGHYASKEAAEEIMVINFLGSCLSSLSSKYAEEQVKAVTDGE